MCYTLPMEELFSLEKLQGMRICVALSGGRDSVALLHCLWGRVKELSAVTCEHGIRGEESLGDLAFVTQLCRAWGIPLTVAREDIPALARKNGRGVEEEGREFRYRTFRAIVESGKADVVATAHHLDDVAETVLFRLIRGTSLAGLSAIEERKGIIRPMLGVRRSQIDDYVRQNDLPFVEDRTNADVAYTRNFLRKNVFPELERVVEGAAAHLVSFASRAAEDDAYLRSLAESYLLEEDGEVSFPQDLPMPLFSRACIGAMKRMGIERDYTSVHVAELASLSGLQNGRTCSLPCGVQATKEGGRIVLYRPRQGAEDLLLSIQEGEYCGEERVLKVDLDAFPEGCVVRTRQEGDFIVPFGGGKKKLKDFLTDKKIPARKGWRLPLIACGSEILVVGGVEISDRVRIRADSVRKGYILCAPKK